MASIYHLGERPFICSEAQAVTLDLLADLQNGGLGHVLGYRPTTDYLVPPVIDLAILISGFDKAKVYERRRVALEGIHFADVAERVAKSVKLSRLPVADAMKAFDDRKAYLISSLSKTLAGDRDDNLRQGFDRNFIRVASGVRVNVKGVRIGNIKEPTLVDGLPILDGILLTYLELGKRVIEPGKARPAPNSGVPVIMGNLIESKLNALALEFKTLSLKANNFRELIVSKNVKINPANIWGNIPDGQDSKDDSAV